LLNKGKWYNPYMATPQYLQVINQFNLELLGLSQTLARQLSRVWGNIGESIQAELVTLATEIADKGLTTREQAIKQARYKSLMAQVLEQITLFQTRTLEPLADETQRKAVIAGQSYATHSIKAVQGKFTPSEVKLSYTKLNTQAVNNIIALSRAGKPLEKIFQTVAPGAVEAMTNILIANTTKGVNPRQTAREMITSGLNQGGLGRALVIARDQQIRAYRDSTRQTYQELGVKKYQRVAAHDKRTCAACLAMDGMKQDSDKVLPLHPQDRCAIIAVVPGYSPNRQTGAQWFEAQDSDTKRAILGQGRFEAYNEGKFDFRQMVTVKPNQTWGDSAQVTSLADLLDGKGGL